MGTFITACIAIGIVVGNQSTTPFVQSTTVLLQSNLTLIYELDRTSILSCSNLMGNPNGISNDENITNVISGTLSRK